VRARRAAVLLPCLAAAAAPGCAGSWFRQGESIYIVRTEVVVDTDPPGAMVLFDGVNLDRAPIRLPVEYDHVSERWARQSNYGVLIREGTGLLGTILLFPIWLPASILQLREEVTRHTYGGNRHVVGAWAEGFEDASREITLEGEAEVQVGLRLERRAPAPGDAPAR
jgi:hypothetical protein